MLLTNQLLSHDLFSHSLPTCLETLSAIENDAELLNSLPEYGSETLNRISGVLGYLNLRIESVDPFLLRNATLDQLQSDVNQINAYLQNPATNLVIDSSLNSLNHFLDSVLTHMVYIPQITNAVELEGIRENVSLFRQSVVRNNDRLKEIHQNVESKNNEITVEFEGLETSFEELQEKINGTSSAFEDKLVQIIVERTEEWQDLLEQNKNVLLEETSNFSDVHKTFIHDTSQKQKEYDEILDGHKESVENLVGIISTNTISGHFKGVADAKNNLTTKWQSLTVVGFVVTIAFGFFALVFEANLDWPSLIARFIVTTALGSFTAYAARQVTKNEAQEKYNRQMEIELKTLTPYIASFSAEDQIKLKEQLFPHIFGKADVNSLVPEQNANTSRISLNPQELASIIGEIIKNSIGNKK